MPIDTVGFSLYMLYSENLVICELHMNEFEEKTDKTQLENMTYLQWSIYTTYIIYKIYIIYEDNIYIKYIYTKCDQTM